MTPIKPFIKWAGGKRQLLHAISERMPKEFANYYEPFIGGGALLLNLQPTNAHINDINSELINTYRQVANKLDDVIAELEILDVQAKQDPRSFYYSARATFNKKIISQKYDPAFAALFIYINKHCFNGLYRVNAKGEFNVPCNGSNTNSFIKENLENVSKYLQTVEITNCDFEVACSTAEKGDFIFFDSPYAPLKATSFEAYTKEGFSVEDHQRLARVFETLSEKGCYCMLTNHNTEFINDLYCDYQIDIIQVKRFINSDASNRKGTEVIIRNY